MATGSLSDMEEYPYMTVQYANQDSWRIIVDGKIVGFANRMTNGGWCVFDADDRRISGQHFKRPINAGQFMREHLYGPKP